MINSSSLIINQPNNLTGEIFIPGDKSITHRAIMLGSLSNGRLDIKNSLLSEDCKRTIDAFIKLGVDITIDDTTISIYGKGLNALKPPCSIIDAGNSGTLARLISGVLAVQNFDSSISGDSSLVKRPMKRIIDPLTVAGANISSNDNLMPLSFKQSGKLKVINYTCLIPSAQIKSCLVLASLFLDGTSIIKETIKTRDHTERMLQFLDYPISIDDKIISINGKGTIVAKDIRIPSDISSASFLIVGALIAPNSNIILKSIGINPFRTGIIDVLIQMGADIKMINHTNIGNEPIPTVSSIVTGKNKIK